MNNLTMQRYVIALGRGFKGSYHQFLKENRTKENFRGSSHRGVTDKRTAALETHVIACLGEERRVVD